MDPNARVLAFGSFVRGGGGTLGWTATAETVGRGPHPFEIHVATPQEYESWCRRFIDVWREV
ncbi:hypothetical protein [Pyrobaculum islandicum]|uniref:hypothetical protein n=1 Tax=Pyrobaculum islandicum TaxID=2277 RepID=UPI00069F03FE|nr:hypothetical protein [Pyrobaculum islandicum]